MTRQEAYAADITYGTNNEFGFDYLRDNMAQNPSQMVLRRPVTPGVGAPTEASEQWYAIIDEVDSILIDEARTPLIISAPAEESGSLYQTFAQVAKRLKPETDYTVDEKFRSVTLTDEGIKHVEDWVGVANLYAPEHVQLVHHLDESLKAQALFQRDKEYVVREGEVVIVDEFTGRLMPGRRYSEGLHQAIEAKEGVEIKRESNTLATISFQNLFRLYAKLSGMTGTAATEAEEFWKIYQIEVVTIPTHRPMVRIDHQDFIYKTEEAKLAAVIAAIKQRHERGQPILIGTISIEKNEAFGKLLKHAGVPFQMLNAKQHEKEAKIIANAGTVGAVTLATNMAGRGVDILLGGEPPKRANSEQRTANRNNDKGKQSDSPVATRHSLQADTAWKEWEEEHQKVLELGGLCVVGTERHEARRIDNQLRGRAGRQGDPGESQFYVSMDDDLMRVFGGDRMKGLMDRLGVPDDQPIQAKMISGALESAQRRVEGHNFDIRKHLVEYDDVMNKHREYIYRLRRGILLAADKQIANSEQQIGETTIDNPLASFAIRYSPVDSLLDQTINLMADEERTAYLEKTASWDENLRQHLPRLVWLRTIDTFWVEHLNAMEALRTGIGLRGYGQHDPLVAYRQEGYQLFERLKHGIEQEVVRVLLSLQVQTSSEQRIANSDQENKPQHLRLQGADDSQSAGFEGGTSRQMEQEAGRADRSQAAGDSPRLGRNEPCHCGSGKKFKKCHGK
ncbi:preprotein translocase subunit SecA [Candidatus Berkelbacteria bacterium]|nr:preprotein translocase subunit SecA [Candidatus Berkelbacteria bacterium]